MWVRRKSVATALEAAAHALSQEAEISWAIGGKVLDGPSRKLQDASGGIAGQLRANRARAEEAQAANASLSEQLGGLQAEVDRLQTRFDLVRKATSDGLWDMLIGDQPIGMDHEIWWSEQFRCLLGFDLCRAPERPFRAHALRRHVSARLQERRLSLVQGAR